MVRRIVSNPTYLSAIVLILALGAYGYLKYSQSRTPKYHNYFGGQIYNFCVNKICFSQENESWVVNNVDKKYPGNKEILDVLAKQLGEVKLEDLVSVNKDKFFSYGIADNSPVIKSNNREITIGNNGLSYDSTYIRADDKIYSIPYVWNSNLYGDVNYWKNKTVTNLPLYQVKKVIIVRGKAEKVFEPKDGKWDNDNLVEKAAHLSAKDIMDAKPANTNETTKISLYVDEKVWTYGVGIWNKSRKETIYWAKDDKDNYYEIDKADFDLLTRLPK